MCELLWDWNTWRSKPLSVGSPVFYSTQKITGDVRVLIDFWELNKELIQKPNPSPVIQDLLQKMERLKYATALDLSVGHYYIPLDEYSQNLCTTVLPWEKFKYKKLSMGIAPAPDIFQEVMNRLLGAWTMLQSTLSTSSQFKIRMNQMNPILKSCVGKTQKHRFNANLTKSFFM